MTTVEPSAAALSRAADASWRHFAPLSSSNSNYDAELNGKPYKIKGKNFVVPGEDYTESHPVAEAARYLFYQFPAPTRWVFEHCSVTFKE